MKTKLPRSIVSLINRKSHAIGVDCAEQARQRFLVELESMKANGATFADLEKYIVDRPSPILQ